MLFSKYKLEWARVSSEGAKFYQFLLCRMAQDVCLHTIVLIMLNFYACLIRASLSLTKCTATCTPHTPPPLPHYLHPLPNAMSLFLVANSQMMTSPAFTLKWTTCFVLELTFTCRGDKNQQWPLTFHQCSVRHKTWTCMTYIQQEIMSCFKIMSSCTLAYMHLSFPLSNLLLHTYIRSCPYYPFSSGYNRPF